MGDDSRDAIAQSYLEICTELECKPVPSVLECLREHSTVAKLPSTENSEQLYAVTTILPFANLEELDLSGLQLSSSEPWCALLEAVSSCTSLRVLSLKGCGLGALGPDAQERVARHLGNCNVAVLDASENQLDDCFLSTLSRGPLLREMDTLTVLDLSENAIGDAGAATLAAVLRAAGLHCSLKQLDLSFNKLGDSAARALAGMMSAAPLLALELEGNMISDAGGLAVAGALKGTLCLQRLNLNYNKLGSNTLNGIADALRVNAGNMQELALAGTSGSEDSMAVLLSAACRSKQLHLLDIRGVPLGGKAVAALCELLQSSCPLVTMRLDVAGKEAAETIARALPSEHTLMHFMMGGAVPEHVLSFIAAALSANTLHKVQEASGGRSSPLPPSQEHSRTPTQLMLQHQKILKSPAPSATPPSCNSRPMGPGSGSRRSPSPAYSQLSSSTSSLNNTPQQGGLFASPVSGRTSAPYRSPGSGGSSRAVGRGNVRTLSMQARRASVIDPQGLAGLAGGGAANKATEVFRRHDLDGSGFLDAEEMMSALQELGMLEGMRPKQLGKFLTDAIREADTDRDGLVSMEEFAKYYERLARHYAEASRQGRITARRRVPDVPLDAPSDESLKRAFRTYCRLPIGQGRQVGGSVQQINAAQFNQLCRDAGLVEPSGPLSQCAVDIIFTRCKSPGSRRLPFKTFLSALAAVADESGFSFAAITAALNGLPPSLQQPPNAAAASTSLPMSRRHSLGNCYAQTRLSISDLTDTRVGPCLVDRSSAPAGRQHEAKQALAMSYDSLLGHRRSTSTGAVVGSGASTPSWTMRASAGAAVWGTRAGSPSSQRTPGSGAVTPVSVGECGAEPATHRQHQPPQQQQQHQHQQQQQQQLQLQQHDKEYPEQPLQQEREAAELGVPRQPPYMTHVLSGRDAVQNPLFEGDSEGGSSVQTVNLNHRLLALEKKIAQRTSSAGRVAISSVGGAAAGAVEQRVTELELGVDEMRQQLSAVLSQQEELKGLLTRLLAGLEATGISSPRQAVSQLQRLGTTVESLSADVCGMKEAQGKLQSQLQGVAGGQQLQEQLKELMQNTDKRHTRVETAIYQVAHQVDLLDSRVKQEQQSTLRTLQALLNANMASLNTGGGA